MSVSPLAILRTGLVTSVGHTAASSCAAIRAKLSNPTETHFLDSHGEWIMAHQVSIQHPYQGRVKLARMAAMAIGECLQDIPSRDWSAMPFILCVAEAERPGRMHGLDGDLMEEITWALDCRFDSKSSIIASGRAGTAVALSRARQLIFENGADKVLIAATDSLLTWPILSNYDRMERLLTPVNSNGFIPGEGAGALLVGRAEEPAGLVCAGLGFGTESAAVSAEQPLRADGLVSAIRAALEEAGCELHDMDFRISDISGEQYFFKEAALAISRVLRQRKVEFDLWHPAECIGEVGAASGIASIVVVNEACRKEYGPGPAVLWHSSADDGQRAAAVLKFRAN
jgi:3-oxoacyl-[acyl-carrier-protein] synthase-1